MGSSGINPPHPLCRTLCLRKVGVGCGIACWFGPRPLPTPSPRNKTLLKLSIYYVCPKPDYNDTTTKKTTVSLLINMRQAQELIGHEYPVAIYFEAQHSDS